MNHGIDATAGLLAMRSKGHCMDPAEVARWDEFVLGHGGHIFQTYAWGQASRYLGWEPQYLIWEDQSGQWRALATVLKRSRLLGALNMCYVPRGPVVLTPDSIVWKAVAKGLAGFTRDLRSILIRMNPLILPSEDVDSILQECGWERATTREMHVRTFRLTLPSNDDGLWGGLEYRTQKAIRKAERAGVKVTKEVDAGALNEFLSLYEATAHRLNISSQNSKFIQAVWQQFSVKGKAHLFLARIDGVAISGLFLFQYGDTMEEMWIGWDDRVRERRPNQYLHWQILRWCLQNGIRTYDFGGVPPDAALDHGVFFYKSGFGAQLVDLIGEYDHFPSAWGRFVWEDIRPIVNRSKYLAGVKLFLR